MRLMKITFNKTLFTFISKCFTCYKVFDQTLSIYVQWKLVPWAEAIFVGTFPYWVFPGNVRYISSNCHYYMHFKRKAQNTSSILSWILHTIQGLHKSKEIRKDLPELVSSCSAIEHACKINNYKQARLVIGTRSVIIFFVDLKSNYSLFPSTFLAVKDIYAIVLWLVNKN